LLSLSASSVGFLFLLKSRHLAIIAFIGKMSRFALSAKSHDQTLYLI